MYGTNKNIDGFYTKTTQILIFRVKKKKKRSVILTYSIFQHVKIRFGRKKILNYAYCIRVEKWSRSV
jgi:hypothetical protein